MAYKENVDWERGVSGRRNPDGSKYRAKRGVVCRKDRKDREGLVEKCADLCADPALTPRADRAGQGALTALTHTLPLKGEEGGAFKAPPPSPHQEGGQADA